MQFGGTGCSAARDTCELFDEEADAYETFVRWLDDAALPLVLLDTAKRAARLATTIRLRTFALHSPWGLSQDALEAPH